MKNIAIILLALVLLAGCNDTPAVEYVVTDNIYNTFGIYGETDLYQSNREALQKHDLVHYEKTFGEIKDAKRAAEVAAIVINDVYKNHDCLQDEAPLMVKYNENANAWAVHGSTIKASLGGVVSVAIAADTGQVIMLFHEK